VLHYTAMATPEAALERLCTPDHEVSAHYLIAPSGEVVAMVDEVSRAWHAGRGRWAGLDDINSRSVGIEIANDGASPFSSLAIEALIPLIRAISNRWGLAPKDVIGHSDMAPQRKCDPGRRFDWRRLAREGVSVWPDDATAQEASRADFTTAARGFGYPDCPDDVLLDAFRQRFRPYAQGPLDAWDVGMAQALARRFPVDPRAALA